MKEYPEYDHDSTDGLIISCGIYIPQYFDIISDMVTTVQTTKSLSKSVEAIEVIIREFPRDAAFHLVQCFCQAATCLLRIEDLIKALNVRLSATAGEDPDMNIEYNAIKEDMNILKRELGFIVMARKKETITFN